MEQGNWFSKYHVRDVALVAAAVVAVVLVTRSAPAALQSPAVYRVGEGALGVGVTFAKSLPGSAYLSVGVDVDRNGAVSGGEWFKRGVPVAVTAGSRSALYGRTELAGDEPVLVAVTVSEKAPGDDPSKGAKFFQTFKNVTIETRSVEKLLDLGTVTKPDQAMKGLPIAAAQVPNAAAGSGTLDIDQRIAECAPTGAANGLYGLAAQHGQADKLPKNPFDAVDGLKADMGWTPADGVDPESFVKGKNEFAVRMGLPIKTSIVGDGEGLNTAEEIKKTLDAGGAAELQLRFYDQGRGKGGHLVSVTAVREVDGKTFVDLHDPLSPSGTDTMELSGNGLDYALSKYETVIGFGFSQVWEGTLSGQPLETMTDAELQGLRAFAGETKKLKVIIVQGKKVSLSEVHIGKGPECLEDGKQMPHYHANRDEKATALDGTVLGDPGGCGYGMVVRIPVEEVEVP